MVTVVPFEWYEWKESWAGSCVRQCGFTYYRQWDLSRSPQTCFQTLMSWMMATLKMRVFVFSKHVRKTEYMAVRDYRAICWTRLHLPNSVKSSSLGRGVGHYGGGFPSTIFEPLLWLWFMETIRKAIDQSFIWLIRLILLERTSLYNSYCIPL